MADVIDLEDDRAFGAILSTIDLEIAALIDTRRAIAVGELAQRVRMAVDAIDRTEGRLLVTGMGKSGLIGRKIAATMASTGTPAMFLHPAEASHGDLGMITTKDTVLALSWSGESKELGDVVTYCGRFGVPLIAITSGEGSALGRAANICLTLPKVIEACPHHLAPTSSTTAQLVLGDALAIALIELRGFSAADFRVFHPGGKLGAQLMLVADLMGKEKDLPRVPQTASLSEATLEMSSKRYGSTAVVDEEGKLAGVFTDGDLRRAIVSASLEDPVANHMNRAPLTVGKDLLASEALKIMNDKAITTLFVCDDGNVIGAIHLHDILRAGVA